MIKNNYEVYNVSPLLINNFGDTFCLLLILVVISIIVFLLKRKQLKSSVFTESEFKDGNNN